MSQSMVAHPTGSAWGEAAGEATGQLSARNFVRLRNVDICALTEAGLAAHVMESWRHGRGGWIVTVNVDILRAVDHDAELQRLISDAEITVADGMPLVWAARLAGDRLPERVTGSSLVETLCGAAASQGRSVYVLGGNQGVPEAAAAALVDRHPGLAVAGTHSPAFGFEKDGGALREVCERVVEARPDLMLTGLGFPKQEKLIAALRPALPRTWFLGCGAGVPMAAGQFARAPVVMQRLGTEWLHRLALEPRRLARRYLREDLPYALVLLAGAPVGRARRRTLGNVHARSM